MNSQGYYTPGYNMGAPTNNMQEGPGVSNLFADPMANAAMMYGSSLANQGKDMVNKEVRKRMIFTVLEFVVITLQSVNTVNSSNQSSNPSLIALNTRPGNILLHTYDLLF